MKDRQQDLGRQPVEKSRSQVVLGATKETLTLGLKIGVPVVLFSELSRAGLIRIRLPKKTPTVRPPDSMQDPIEALPGTVTPPKSSWVHTGAAQDTLSDGTRVVLPIFAQADGGGNIDEHPKKGPGKHSLENDRAARHEKQTGQNAPKKKRKSFFSLGG